MRAYLSNVFNTSQIRRDFFDSNADKLQILRLKDGTVINYRTQRKQHKKSGKRNELYLICLPINSLP